MTDQTQQPDVKAATRGALEKAWGDKYDGEFNSAMSAWNRAGIPNAHFDDIMRSPALAYQALAKLGASGGGVQQSQQAPDVRRLLTHPAAGDPKHPEHRAVRAQLDSHYAARHPGGILP